jgi:hypothetical protein
VDARLEQWDQRTRVVIVLAALGPIIVNVLVEGTGPLVLTVDLVSWGIFVVDLVVRSRIKPGYVLTGSGMFDLSIVLLTFPWYALPGAGETQFMALFRLARLLRLIGTPAKAGSPDRPQAGRHRPVHRRRLAVLVAGRAQRRARRVGV